MPQPIAETTGEYQFMSTDEAAMAVAAPMRPLPVAEKSLASKIAAFGPLPMAAAIAMFAAGTGWLGANAHMLTGQPTPQQQAKVEIEEMAQNVTRLNGEIQQLREQTTQLAAISRPAQPNLGPLTTKVDQLASSLERVQKDTQSRLSGVIEQQGRLASALSAERREAAKISPLKTAAKPSNTTDHISTGSLPPVRPANFEPPTPPKADLSHIKIDGYAVREVYGKMAVIEDKRGIVYELMKGESLPGIGRIQKLEKKGAGWLVITDKGYIAAK